MKKVLLADDEEIIRMGISTLIPWDKLDLELVCIAENGQKALNYILTHTVDIIITDIRMPVMDGLELVQTCYERELCSHFILLTGYSEFEYAQSAMKYGVRHYLVKPTDESEIIQSLKELSAEIDERSSHNHLFTQLVKTAPSNLFRDLLTQAETDSAAIYQKRISFFSEMLKYREGLCALAFLQLEEFPHEDSSDALSLFILENISHDIFPQGTLLCTTTLNSNLLFLLSDITETEAAELCIRVLTEFETLYHQPVSVTLSSFENLREIDKMYHTIQKNCSLHYYLPPGAVLTASDAEQFYCSKNDSLHPPIFLNELAEALHSYDPQQISLKIQQIFSDRGARQLSNAELKERITNVYYKIRNELLPSDLEPSITLQEIEKQFPLTCILDLKHLPEAVGYLQQFACRIAEVNYQNLMLSQQDSVEKIKLLVSEEISNPALSLKWIAQNKLFMNENYLSRLFQKKTGCKFSGYLTEQRMKHAKHLLKVSPDMKLNQLCQETGYSNNPAYFSTLFKNYFGCTLTQYKQKIQKLPDKKANNDGTA